MIPQHLSSSQEHFTPAHVVEAARDRLDLITITSRRTLGGVELILWSDGKASRHWPGGEEWISLAEFRKGKIGQAEMFG